MPNWFEIKAQQENSPAEIYIYDYIGLYGVEAKAFIDALNGLDASAIHLRLNTPGGSVFEGNAIYNALKRHSATITTYIDGLAASMGSVIALAGEKIVIADNALYMIHNPWSTAYGDARELRKTADTLDKMRQSMLNIYQTKTGLDIDVLSAMVDEETWLNASECIEQGFADEITTGITASASFSADKFKGYKQVPEQLIATEASKPKLETQVKINPPAAYNHRTPLYARLTEIAAGV